MKRVCTAPTTDDKKDSCTLLSMPLKGRGTYRLPLLLQILTPMSSAANFEATSHLSIHFPLIWLCNITY